MIGSTIVSLVRYHTIFGDVDCLSRHDAEAKLARERELYRRWRWPHHPDPPIRVCEPWIEYLPFQGR